MSAGLPNITGSFSYDINSGALGLAGVSGAFIVARNSYQKYYSTGSIGDGFEGFSFNAKYSSSIYGNASTVQPSSLTTNYVIKY